MMEIEKNPKPAKDVLEVHSNEESVSEHINDLDYEKQTPKFVVDP